MDEPRECALCDTAWGAFAVVVALALGYIGLDLLTGGRVTGALFRTEVAGDSGD